MQIQVFSEYLQLAQAGKVDFLACPMHLTDIDTVFQLTHSLVGEDKVLLECYACGYKNMAGEQLYQTILGRIKAVEN